MHFVNGGILGWCFFLRQYVSLEKILFVFMSHPDWILCSNFQPHVLPCFLEEIEFLPSTKYFKQFFADANIALRADRFFSAKQKPL